MVAYYNEFDAKTAAWLRELIKIARGLQVSSSCDQEAGGKLGTEPKPFLATWCYLLIVASLVSRALVCGQLQEHEILRMPGMNVVRFDYFCRSVKAMRQQEFAPLCVPDKSFPCTACGNGTREQFESFAFLCTPENRSFSLLAEGLDETGLRTQRMALGLIAMSR